MSKTHTTGKGTELPILNLRGKDYLEVKYRVVWFREEHPDWTIDTELLNVTDNSAYAKASIRDESGRTIATSHKFENIQGFADFIEKAETGAIGRALALIGYGTQFCADDLDEGKRIVDSPRDPKPKGKDPIKEIINDDGSDELTNYVVKTGNEGLKGKMLKEIPTPEIEKYIKWANRAKDGKKPIQWSTVRADVEAMQAFLTGSK